MTAVTDRPTAEAPPEPRALAGDSLPAAVPWALAALALAIGVAVAVLAGGPNLFAGAAATLVTYLVAISAVAFRVEGSRKATNRVVGTLITSAFLLVLAPLVSLVWTVVERGSARFDVEFFTSDMRNVLGEGGGAQHAIIGTLIMTGIAALISVPLGLLVSIYLVEYGRGRLARSVTTMVDVMTGIPSIVAGLFAYAVFVIFQGPGARSGLAGGVALAVLMTPVVIRSAEEMLRLVPNELREASYALGVPKWRTIVKVVLPTAIAGILTGIMLAVARVIGETAPLLIVAGLTSDTNVDPFEGRMTSLPVQAYYSYATPGRQAEFSYDRGWAASLTLVLIVATLFFLARILAKVLQPKGLR